MRRNLLVIGTTNTETPFLAENELPDCARLSGPRSDEDSSSVIEMEDQDLAKALNESAAAGPSSQPVAAPPPAADKFSEADVQNLVSMGFSRQQVVDELRMFNGDVTQATAALFAKSFQF